MGSLGCSPDLRTGHVCLCAWFGRKTQWCSGFIYLVSLLGPLQGRKMSEPGAGRRKGEFEARCPKGWEHWKHYMLCAAPGTTQLRDEGPSGMRRSGGLGAKCPEDSSVVLGCSSPGCPERPGKVASRNAAGRVLLPCPIFDAVTLA